MCSRAPRSTSKSIERGQPVEAVQLVPSPSFLGIGVVQIAGDVILGWRSVFVDCSRGMQLS